MRRFRKKPVVIEAYRWNVPVNGLAQSAHDIADGVVRGTSYQEIARLLGTSGCSKTEPFWDWAVLGIVDTLEGPHIVEPGDWIIRGVKNELYPCKSDIFEATYDPAD